MTARIFATIAVALLVAAGPAQATEPFGSPRSEVAISVLEFPVGLRNIGMGATGVADVNQPSNGYYNPATLAWSEAAMFSFGYQDLFTHVSMTDSRLSFGHRSTGDSTGNSWRVGGVLGYTTFDIESVVVRTIYLPEGTGESRDVSDYYLTSAVAGAWQRGRESFAAGVAAKYLTLDYSDATSWLFDYGFVAAIDIFIDGSTLKPRLGFAVTDLDTGLEIDSTEYDIAGQTRFGVGVDFATPPTKHAGRDVALASGSFDADYTDAGNYDSFWSIGWELSVLELVQARAGYQWYENDSGYTNNRSNLSFGFGIGWEFGKWIVHADYAHVRPRPAYFNVDLDRDMFGATLGARF